MQAYSYSPLEMLRSFWRNRRLLSALIKREVVGRYQGSVLGLLWSLFNPILMLSVYTFVFSVVFKARWSGGGDSKSEFALVLFSGLLVFNLFAECLNKAPSLIISNANYVKKVIFPLETLPFVSFGAALFHAIVAFLVWLVFYIALIKIPPATIFLTPVMLLPVLFISIGAGWLFASLGVFFRDVSQIIGIFTTALLFLSPVFYPMSTLPEEYQKLLYYNPMTLSIEFVRKTMIEGGTPDWQLFSSYLLATFAFALLSFAWFQKTRKGFADVL